MFYAFTKDEDHKTDAPYYLANEDEEKLVMRILDALTIHRGFYVTENSFVEDLNKFLDECYQES